MAPRSSGRSGSGEAVQRHLGLATTAAEVDAACSHREAWNAAKVNLTHIRTTAALFVRIISATSRSGHSRRLRPQLVGSAVTQLADKQCRTAKRRFVPEGRAEVVVFQMRQLSGEHLRGAALAMTRDERRAFLAIVARYKQWRDARRVGYEAWNAALKALSQILSDLGWTNEALRELDKKRRDREV